MDKPEDIPQDVWVQSVGLWSEAHIRGMSTGEEYGPVVIARAILSAQSQAYIDAARIAEEWEPVEKLLPFADDSHNEAAHTGQYEAGERISAAILQRKEEVGRN